MFFNFNPYRFGRTDNQMWEPISKFSKSSATLSSETAFTGLEGDTYDYRVFIDQDSARVNINQNIDMQFNNDTSSNYKRLISRGVGLTPVGHSLMQTSIWYTNCVYTAGDSSASILEITGKSGAKRNITGQTGFANTGNAYIEVRNDTWNNTLDELTSIQLIGDAGNYTFDAYLFRRKKDSLADDGLEQVGIIDLAGKTTADFTGLDGDNDGEYILELQGYVDNGTAGAFYLRFNNDAGNNYAYQYLQNSGTLIANFNTATQLAIYPNANIQQDLKLNISPQSGMPRAILMTLTADNQFNAGYTWNNTVNNITSINCTFPAGATGVLKLYKRASKESELVTREAIDGALSHTWSSLDSSNCIYRIKANLTDKGTNAGILSLQINGDTANNYTRQQLYATTTNEGSANITADYVFLGQDDNEKPATVEAYIFPKVGSKRTILVKTYYNSPTAPYILWHYTTWNNTVDAITSLKIFAGANPVIGEVSLEKIDVTIPAVLLKEFTISGADGASAGVNGNYTLNDVYGDWVTEAKTAWKQEGGDFYLLMNHMAGTWEITNDKSAGTVFYSADNSDLTYPDNVTWTGSDTIPTVTVNWKTTYVITNAGTAEVNGTFTESLTGIMKLTNGSLKRTFLKGGVCLDNRYIDPTGYDGSYSIYNTAAYYHTAVGEDVVPEDGVWEVNEGAAPVPTVTKVLI